MKDYLAKLIRSAPTPIEGRNRIREYLQARILGALQRAGAMIPLAFHGGTALRFLYATARYSEDLDFAREKERSRYDFRGYLRVIQSELTAEGYVIELKVNDKKDENSSATFSMNEYDPFASLPLLVYTRRDERGSVPGAFHAGRGWRCHRLTMGPIARTA